MGREKDILKSNGKRGDYKTFRLKWAAHSIRTKFATVNKNVIHPDMPKDGICVDKSKMDKEEK